MFDFLKKPYPAHHPNRENLYTSLAVGVFVGGFLLAFQPFGLDKLHSPYKNFLILFFGVITFVVVIFFNNILPYWVPMLREDKTWNVGKEILYLNGLILSIAICNTLYTPFLSPDQHLTLGGFTVMVFNTFLIGIVPIAFFVVIDYNRLLKRYMAESQSLKLGEKQAEVQEEPRRLKISTEGEDIDLHPKELLYVESVGNYANVVSQKENQLQKNLYRSTLKYLDSNISTPYIIRCHRSYLVNLEQVQSVAGNAQGFKLTLKDCDEIIPVSRKYVPLVKAYFA